MIELWTDGACSKNGYAGAKGGWAFIVLVNGEMVYSENGAEKETTNQRMELIAAIKGCEYCREHYPEEKYIMVYSDSAYLINCNQQKWYKSWMKNGWVNSQKQPVANQLLWIQLINYFEDDRISWYKVKGHANSYWNEKVDELAVNARREI